MVTGAGIAMIVIGILITLAGLLALFVGAIIGGASNAFDVQAPGFGSIAGAAAAVVIVFSIIVLAIGILDIIAAINVFSGRSWARWTGIVVAGLLILFSLGSLGSGDSGGVIVGLVWIAANAFVIYALAVAGSWFALRGT